MGLNYERGGIRGAVILPEGLLKLLYYERVFITLLGAKV